MIQHFVASLLLVSSCLAQTTDSKEIAVPHDVLA